ncbi:MAG TPA: hypothetical protein DIC22_04985, partial [Chitinophagaceae bacterium]|nr:hypothetical protein [Chitinophagaceae bacterium]
MRIIFLLFASISFFSPKAQVYLPVGSMNYNQWQAFPAYHPAGDSSHINQKWFFSKYSGLSAGFGFFNGVHFTMISAPLGLQMNRQLNNNLVAFAGVSAAPAFFSFSRSFSDPLIYKSYPGSSLSNAYGLGMNTGVDIGLMYINDAKTFSISGSIGIERSNYP